MEEPDLREDERPGNERGRRDSGRARHEQDERDQPDDVLRGHEAVEDEEPGHRRARREHEALGVPGAADEEPPDRGHSDRLEERGDRRERVRELAREVSGRRARRSVDDGRRIEPELVRREQDARTEAFDLQAARGL